MQAHFEFDDMASVIGTPSSLGRLQSSSASDLHRAQRLSDCRSVEGSAWLASKSATGWLPPPTPDVTSSRLRAPLSGAATLSERTCRPVSFTSLAFDRRPAIKRACSSQGTEFLASHSTSNALHSLQRLEVKAQPHGSTPNATPRKPAARYQSLVPDQNSATSGSTCEAPLRQGTRGRARQGGLRFASLTAAVEGRHHQLADAGSSILRDCRSFAEETTEVGSSTQTCPDFCPEIQGRNQDMCLFLI